jgi:hypothetical protein
VEKKRQSGCEKENEYDRTFKLAKQKRKSIRPLWGPKEIGAKAREPLLGFSACQSLLCGFEFLEKLGSGEVPKG